MKTSKKLLASLCTAVLVLTSMATLFTGAAAASASEAWNLLKPDTAFAASGSNTYENGVTKITSAGEVNFTGLTSLTADDSFIIEATINLATVGPENWHGPRIRVRYTDEQNYYFVNFYGSHMAVEGNYIHEDGSLQGYGWAPTYANTNYIRSANSTIKVKIISHPESISVYVDDVLMIDNAPVKKMNVLTGFQSTDNDTTYTAKAVISRAFPANDVPAAPTGFTSILTPTSEVSASPAASFSNGVVSMNGLSELLFTNLPLTADDTFMLKTKIDLTSVGAEGWHGPRITVRKNSETEYTQIAFLDGAVSLLNRKFFGRTVVRAIFFIPVVLVSGVVSNTASQTGLMDIMSSAAQTGGEESFELASSVSMLLTSLNMGEGVTEFISSSVENISEIVQSSGVQIFIFIAALQEIPTSLYEASEVEGCSKWESFWKITFPMLLPQILVVTIYTFVDCLSDSTLDLYKHLDSLAFSQQQYSYASSMYWLYSLSLALIVLIVAGIVGAVNRSSRKGLS